MNKLDIAKKAVTIVVGMGTTKIVSGIIQNNTTPEKLADKVAILSASVVLGSMAADYTSQYTNAKIDQIAEWWNENVKKKLESSDY